MPMPHYVYIIYSESSNIYYKGEAVDVYRRLEAHNSDMSTYIRGKGPWRLVFIEELPSRTEALKREKMLKRQNRLYIEWLILQPINKLTG